MPQADKFEVDIRNLVFDPQNPRIPEGLDGHDEGEILEWMLRNGDLLGLMSSIGATGYSNAEPLLAISDGGDKFIVVEGNRRLAALKLLLNPERATVRRTSVKDCAEQAIYRPEHVPVIVSSSRDEVLAYLGYRHITGVKPWGPLQKAKYLKQLFTYYMRNGQSPAESLRQIAKVAATRTGYAKKILSTLALYEEALEKAFWGINEIDSSGIDFSILSTSLAYESISNFIQAEYNDDFSVQTVNVQHVKELFSWLYIKDAGGKARVPESRKLSSLARVIANPIALEVFRGGRKLEDADSYTNVADENFQRLIVKALEALQEAEDISINVKDVTESNIEALRTIYKLAHRLGVVFRDRQETSAPF